MGEFRRARRAMCVGLAVTLSLVAAACGGDDDDAGSEPTSQASATTASTTGSDAETGATTESVEPGSTTAETEADASADATLPDDVDPEGILQFGNALTSGVGVHFDTTQMGFEAPNINWAELVFGTLMRQAEDGSLQPSMAEDVEVVDPQTVQITLRPGITFTDGSAYDAEAVKTSLLRQRFESATPQIASRLDAGFLALSSVDVVDPTTVVVHLDKPIAAAFLESLASIGGIVHSPKQIAEAPADIDLSPIGAGPYVLDEYRPEQLIALRKNPDYWDADSWQLGGVDFVHTPLGPTQANALLAGTIDMNIQVPIGSIEALKSNQDLTTIVDTSRIEEILLCKKPPFDNPEVRKAVSMAIDREGFNDLVFDGLGVPAYGFYQEDDPRYDPATKELLTYDPDAAKQMLADAGVSDLTLDIVIVSTNNQSREAEALQAQLQEVGITVNVIPLDNVYADWIEPQKEGALLAPLSANPVGGYVMFAKQAEEGGAQNYCGTEQADIMGPVNEAVQLPGDDPEAIDLWREANLAYVESSYNIPVIFLPTAVTWNTSKVGGEPTFSDMGGIPRLRFDSVYVKS